MMLLRWTMIVLAAVGLRLAAADPDQDKINTAVEALTRLENVNLDERPAIKTAVSRLLDRTRGTPNFVRLVRHFNLTNEQDRLMEVAVAMPEQEAGVEAIRLVLASGNLAPIRAALESTNAATAVHAAQALGNAKEKQVVPLLKPLVAGQSRSVELGRAAVVGLAQTHDGATALLGLARQEKLPDNLKFLASSELNAARWPDIKAEAAKLLPLPAGQNAAPLPPVATLARMKGDPANGAQVFRRESTGCSKCHQVRGEGRDVGPALSEIGTKLAREALYEAILDPSAGISFGFEAWQVALKSGDEVYGLKVNETADEIAIKDTNAIITRYKRAEIASMQQSKTSIMPAGLQATMTTQELVDLVEYLSSLKKQ